MKRILVTGGAGFIGFNLCKTLLEQGEYVIVVDNNITSGKRNLIPLSRYPNFSFIFHDINETFPDSIKKFNKIDTIYHLACPTGVPNIGLLAEEMLLTCSLGTRNVLEFATEKNSSIVFTSSSEVYGNPSVFPQDEDYTGNVSTTGYRSPYEEGKRFSESLIIMYSKKYSLNAKIARIFNTYGYGMSNEDRRVIPRLLKLSKNNKPLQIYGDGTQTRTFCFVDDLVQGLMLIEKNGKSGDVYNLGDDKEIEIYELAKLILKLTGTKSGIEFADFLPHDHNRRLPLLKKIKKLGWKPKVSLESGISKTIQWYNKK